MQEHKKTNDQLFACLQVKTELKLRVCQQMESTIGVLLIAKNVSLFSHSYEVSPITRWSNQEVLQLVAYLLGQNMPSEAMQPSCLTKARGSDVDPAQVVDSLSLSVVHCVPRGSFEKT